MLVAWAIALALGAGAFRLAAFCAGALPRPSPLEELAYYPSGRHLEPATLGHPETAADLAWIRAVQYYGEHRHRDNRFVRMFHIFDILTTLAPRFESAYVFGAFALAQEGRDFPDAERLIQKGIENNPRSAWLAFEAGFLYYIKPDGRDLPHAAEYFERSARLPGAPALARRFAAFSRQNAGELALAYQLWAQIRDGSPNAYLREIAEREMDRIRRALAAGREDLARNRLATPRVILADRP
jgi:hypothetical protein